MQIKLFTIPIGDSGTAVEEMNRFSVRAKTAAFPHDYNFSEPELSGYKKSSSNIICPGSE